MRNKFISRARLVKAAKRWHIDYTRHDPATGQEKRHRHDFALNEIEDLQLREQVAARLVAYIDQFATEKKGRVVPAPDAPEVVTLAQAVKMALSVKMRLPRENSRRGYSTVARALLEWCRRMHYEKSPVCDFGRRQARAFFEDLRRRREYRGRTLNNYLERLRGLWQELAKDDIIKENPWSKITPIRTGEKLRRMFTDEERRTVAAEVERCDYWLFRGLLLQFFCYVRPVELCRLRFRDFDLGRGVVTVREEAAKGWRKVVKTIPASVLHYFVDGRFDKVPGNYFLFGRVGEGARAKMEPSPLQIDENRPYKRHARILKRLHDAGALPGDIFGLTWYSWKDTGISLHAAKTSPLSTRDQAGHVDFAVTSIYYHAPEVNEEYQRLGNDLF